MISKHWQMEENQKIMLSFVVKTEPIDTHEIIGTKHVKYIVFRLPNFQGIKNNKSRNTQVNENDMVSWHLYKIHSLWCYCYGESYPMLLFFFKGKQSYHYGYQPVKRFVYGNQQFLKIVHDTKQVRFIHFDEWLHQSNTAFTGTVKPVCNDHL